MSEIQDELLKIIKNAENCLVSAKTISEVEDVKVKALGRNGSITAISKTLISLPVEKRPEAGKALNSAKNKLTELFEEAKLKLEDSLGKKVSNIDISLPGRKLPVGKKHPITQTIDDCVSIFRRIGFIVADGPDIDTVRNCFDALNTPEHHPSRELSDTFYFEDGRLLRTHTSTIQIRVMEAQQPPVRIIAPGPAYRPDSPDATHSANFYQIEGLYVDKNVSLADLKGTMSYLAKELMGENVKVRLRPHFFPFTEPSVEYDFSCIICGGKGCQICKKSGWLEIGGAGMVDPNVFKNVGYDPEVWTGFAFGCGIERIAMIRHRIHDIRYFYENDMRFLNQF